MTQQTLGSREGLTRSVVTSVSDFDLAAVARLITGAWAADYVDKIRIDFHEDQLRHLMNGDAWYAVMVCTDDGQPVGFELALNRRLFCHGEPLNTYLVSAFTVSEHHRRKGIGRWLLQGINEVAFKHREADLLFSTFHHGAAGSPTVQSTFDQIEGFAVNRFSTFPSWGRRIDKEPLPPLGRPASATQLRMSTGSRDWETYPEGHAGPSDSVPTLAEFTETTRIRYDVAFAVDATFRDYYLCAEPDEAGALWYDFEDGATCLVTYGVTPLIVNERVLKPTGLIQAVHTEHCQPEHFERLLIDLGHRFLAQGCFAMSLYDSGVFPHAVLEAFGMKADDKYYYAVRGPREITERFSDVKPPLFLDFM